MKKIQEHIKSGNFARAYLLYGEEDYLKRTYKNKLKTAIVGDDDMNYSYYEGKNSDVNEIKDTSDTLPFFAERRLILMEDSGAFKSSSDELTAIVKDAPDTTYFVFVESEVDKRNKLFKLVSDLGYVTELKTPATQDVAIWLGRMMAGAGKKITTNDMNYLLERAGQESDMDNLVNETEKLIAYTGEREVITRNDIDAICTTQTVDRVFDMIEAIGMRNPDRAMQLYADLVNLKEPSLKILTLIGRQFAQLLAVKEYMNQGLSNGMILQKMNIKPYFLNKYMGQAKCFSLKELREAVEDCAQADQDIKTGVREERYALELVLLKLCRK